MFARGRYRGVSEGVLSDESASGKNMASGRATQNFNFFCARH